MLTTTAPARRWVAGAAAIALAISLTALVGGALAAGPELADQPTLAQGLPTPTPFRFLTPTPFVPGATTRPATTTTTSTPAPRAGGFPLEFAFPLLAGGLAAIGGGTFLFRRKANR
jgi:hypothetical protein